VFPVSVWWWGRGCAGGGGRGTVCRWGRLCACAAVCLRCVLCPGVDGVGEGRSVSVSRRSGINMSSSSFTTPRPITIIPHPRPQAAAQQLELEQPRALANTQKVRRRRMTKNLALSAGGHTGHLPPDPYTRSTSPRPLEISSSLLCVCAARVLFLCISISIINVCINRLL